MKKFAVIGHPIGHSLSPVMHNTAFQILDMDSRYEALDISPAQLQQAFADFRESEWGGLNITTPHKESAIPFVDTIDPDAKKIGAINTVVKHNNALKGYNTDIIGIEQSLRPYQKSIEGEQCTLLGSGGVARAISYVLTQKIKPQSITIAAQFPEQARALVESLGNSEVNVTIVPYSENAIVSAVNNCILVINATTVGMYPHIDDCPLPDHCRLTEHQIVFDVIYRPLKTRLLKMAQSSGAKIIDGLEMFIQQGAAAFQLWTGKPMPTAQARQALENILQSDESQ